MKGTRFQRKQQDYHFSSKTGSQKRKRKKNYILNERESIQEKKLELEVNKLELEVKKLELEDKRFKLSRDINNFNHKRIIRNTNDEVIFEMNEENISRQNHCIKELASCLNRLNIPYDMSQRIVSYALGDVYIEPCIFQIMPDDILEYFVNGEREYLPILKIKYENKENISEFLMKTISYFIFIGRCQGYPNNHHIIYDIIHNYPVNGPVEYIENVD